VDNQTTASALNMILVHFEHAILMILIACLDPIVMGLNANLTRLDIQQEIFNHLATQHDYRSPSSSSEDDDASIPSVR